MKIHKITPASGKERGDIEVKDYVVLQKPRDSSDCLPPPRALIMDFTLTHTRQLTHTRCSDGAPDPDGALREVDRTKYVITDSCILTAQTQ